MQNDPDVIVLENVRGSYLHVFEAHVSDEDKAAGKPAKFSATFILDVVKHAALIKKVEAVTDRVALDFFKKKVVLKNQPLRDGNERPDSDGYGDGVMFIGARADRRPEVRDSDLSPLVKEDGKLLFGDGPQVNAVIRLFAYDHPKGGKGVSAALCVIQYVKAGPSFGAGNVKVEDYLKPVASGGDEMDNM